MVSAVTAASVVRAVAVSTRAINGLPSFPWRKAAGAMVVTGVPAQVPAEAMAARVVWEVRVVPMVSRSVATGVRVVRVVRAHRMVSARPTAATVAAAAKARSAMGPAAAVTVATVVEESATAATVVTAAADWPGPAASSKVAKGAAAEPVAPLPAIPASTVSHPRERPELTGYHQSVWRATEFDTDHPNSTTGLAFINPWVTSSGHMACSRAHSRPRNKPVTP